MVWQDFMFACATYPEDDPYPQLIEREAKEAVSRLAHHPSIVLWCGGNENVLGYESWGWKRRMPRRQKWGERYFFDILPRVVRKLDPSRPYWPDSPHSATTRTSVHPNDPDHGDRHTWDAKVEDYRDIVPRFCSEFGHQSPPCWATMREAWGEDQLRFDSHAMAYRQRATSGNDVWYGEKVLGHRFRQPRDFDEWLYLAHLLQARAMSIGIEWLRVNRPRCMGALFWQFNDAWAGHSWSCIDSAGRRKPAWHAVRRSFAPRLLSIQAIAGDLRVCAINDDEDAWQPPVRMRRMHMGGQTIAECTEHVPAGPGAVGCSRPLAQVLGTRVDPRNELLVAEAEGCERALWFFQHDRLLALPEPRLDTTVSSDANKGLRLTLQARTLIKDVVIAADRVDGDASIDDAVITFLPGDERTLRIQGVATTPQLDVDLWSRAPVFWCANRFTVT
jgi:beta-mannosidase